MRRAYLTAALAGIGLLGVAASHASVPEPPKPEPDRTSRIFAGPPHRHIFPARNRQKLKGRNRRRHW